MEYRRNLPHIQPQGAMFFVTIRLYGSVPVNLLEQWNSDYNNTNSTDISGKAIKELKTVQQENYFEQLDNYLDTNENGPYFMAEEQIAKIIKEALHYRDGEDYKLICYCIMSNHLHFIIYNLQQPLHIILKEFKSYTGKEAMKILGQMDSLAPARLKNSSSRRCEFQGSTRSSYRFWQQESFDRIVRNRNDMDVKIKYTLNNPVKAGLVNHWKQYKWTYCRPEFLE